MSYGQDQSALLFIATLIFIFQNQYPPLGLTISFDVEAMKCAVYIQILTCPMTHLIGIHSCRFCTVREN